jgi:hypothetical protein
MLILMRTYKYKGFLCRDHAVENATEWLKKTLVTGWWGFFSFFVNFFVIATDVVALQKAKKIPPPDAAPTAVPVSP